mmetsp:Transcript_16400/g.46955  ORF Transcript_16400/g.46955 Transcript_16400/m.46955 type:complete len:485 (+) Transcript_16400:109-1563(+)
MGFRDDRRRGRRHLCGDRHGLWRGAHAAQEDLSPPKQLLSALILRLGADEHLAPDLVLDFLPLRRTVVLENLNGAEAAELHDLVLVDERAPGVHLVDDVHLCAPPPLPALLAADLGLDVPKLAVNLLQGLGDDCRGVGLPFRPLLLHADAELPEAQGLHGLLRVRVLTAAAHDEGRPGLAAQRGLQQLGELGVVEGHAGRLPARAEALRALLERLDAALQREQALVDVVRLRDALPAVVVLPPRHGPELLLAADTAARRAEVLVGAALADALGAAQVDERQRGLHELLGGGRPLAEAQHDDGVRSGAPLVHRRAGLALRGLAPPQHVLQGREVGDRHLALPFQDVAVAHTVLRRAVRPDPPTEKVADVVAEDLHDTRAELHLEALRLPDSHRLEDLPRDPWHETLLCERRIVVDDVRAEHGVRLPAAGLAVDDEGPARAVEEVVRQAQAALPKDAALRGGLVEDLVELPVADADARRDGQHRTR